MLTLLRAWIAWQTSGLLTYRHSSTSLNAGTRRCKVSRATSASNLHGSIPFRIVYLSEAQLNLYLKTDDVQTNASDILRVRRLDRHRRHPQTDFGHCRPECFSLPLLHVPSSPEILNLRAMPSGTRKALAQYSDCAYGRGWFSSLCRQAETGRATRQPASARAAIAALGLEKLRRFADILCKEISNRLFANRELLLVGRTLSE
jgi:hypothetical protein